MLWKFILLILLFAGFIYIISPIDIIPDIIPVIGWMDDVFVGLLMIIGIWRGFLR